MFGIVHVIRDLRTLNVLRQRQINAFGTVALHLVMAVHLLRRFAEQEDHLWFMGPIRKVLARHLFVQIMRRRLEPYRRILPALEKSFIVVQIMLVHIGRRIEPIHLIGEKERLLLRTAVDLRMGCQPKVQAAGPTLWGAANDDIRKRSFVHSRKIVRFDARP